MRVHASLKYVYDGAYVDDLVPFILTDTVESDDFVRARLRGLRRERLKRKARKELASGTEVGGKAKKIGEN